MHSRVRLNLVFWIGFALSFGSVATMAQQNAEEAAKAEITTPSMTTVNIKTDVQVALDIEIADAEYQRQIATLKRPTGLPTISGRGGRFSATTDAIKVGSLATTMKVVARTTDYPVPDGFEHCGLIVREISAVGTRFDDLLHGKEYSGSYAYSVAMADERTLRVSLAVMGNTIPQAGRTWVEFEVEHYFVPENTAEVHRKSLGCKWPLLANNPPRKLCVCQSLPFAVVARANCWDAPSDFRTCVAAWTKQYARCVPNAEPCSASCTTFESPLEVASSFCHRSSIVVADDACSALITQRVALTKNLRAYKYSRQFAACATNNKRTGTCKAEYETTKNDPARAVDWKRLEELYVAVKTTDKQVEEHQKATGRACGSLLY